MYAAGFFLTVLFRCIKAGTHRTWIDPQKKGTENREKEQISFAFPLLSVFGHDAFLRGMLRIRKQNRYDCLSGKRN